MRFIVEVAWQAHFVTNMFLRPTAEELKNYGEPEFVVMTGSKITNPKWKEHGLNSEVFTAFNLTEKMQVIGGTWYGGEMKKGMFAMMNYYLPLKGMPSMHCSANVGSDGDVAVFFGLSGTGKTTLSTDAHRALIGDDEHGWDDDGIFNFEGGCYAKTINLDKEAEPEIYAAIKRDALLENVSVDENGKIDFDDGSVTQNTRVSYPIYHIENIAVPSKAGHAKKVIFLTADAFGVMPPVSKLTPEQTQYHFLSGFTAKLAGTERGVEQLRNQPSRPALGRPSLPFTLPSMAKNLLRRWKSMAPQHILFNTGWNGSGKRISIQDTRGIINTILDGSIDKAPTKTIPIFNLAAPTALPGVHDEILDPRDTYADPAEWEEKARDLAGRFIKNFEKYTDNEHGKSLVAAGPIL